MLHLRQFSIVLIPVFALKFMHGEDMFSHEMCIPIFNTSTEMISHSDSVISCARSCRDLDDDCLSFLYDVITRLCALYQHYECDAGTYTSKSWKHYRRVGRGPVAYMQSFKSGTTINLSSLNITARNRNWLTFKILGCRDGQMVLFSPDNTVRLVISIGSGENTYTAFMWKEKWVTYKLGKFLDCDQFKAFWVSWYNGTVHLGEGSIINEEIVVTWSHPNLTLITDIGITGYNSLSEWLFPGFNNQN